MLIRASLRSKLCILILASLIFSCSPPPENHSSILESINEGLNKSYQIHTQSNQNILSLLEDKMHEPASHLIANIWYPKASLIHDLTEGMVGYIEKFKRKLKKEGHIKSIGDYDSIASDDKSTAYKLFSNQGNGKILQDSLVRYRLNILLIDTNIFKNFKDDIYFISKSTENKKTGFVQSFTKSTSALEALSLLNQVQNNIRILENKLLIYCLEHVRGEYIHQMEAAPIIAISSSIVGKGEKMTIRAGLGSFTSSPDLKIYIDGRKIEFNNSFAKYSFIAPRKLGKHQVHIKMEYIDQDLITRVIDKDVIYTVIR